METDGFTGDFVATSPHSGVAVRSKAFIEVRLPETSVARPLNPVLQSVHDAGLGTEQQLLTADGIHSTGKLLVSGKHQLVDAQGRAQDRIFGIGPGTSGWGTGAFARPGTNAAPFRENDALARQILTVAAGLFTAGSGSRPAGPAAASPSTRSATQPAAVGKA